MVDLDSAQSDEFLMLIVKYFATGSSLSLSQEINLIHASEFRHFILGQKLTEIVYLNTQLQSQALDILFWNLLFCINASAD